MTDLSDFVGCALELVSVSQYQVILNFDGLRNIGISIEGDYSVVRPDNTESLYTLPPDGAGDLVVLLGVLVRTVVVTEPGTTTIRFADRSAIAVFDSKTHYESYQIYIGERLIIV